MTTIPGFAVGLLGLLAVYVSLGMIQLTRHWLRPLLHGFALILKVIPLVGGFLSREVMALERLVDGWLARAALGLQRLGAHWLHAWQTLFSRITGEIAGLALDAYHAISRVIRVTIPKLIRALRTQLLRLLKAAESRIVALARLVARDAKALALRIANLARTVAAAVLRGVREAERFALSALRTVEHALLTALGAVWKAIQVVEHRIGQLEHMVVNEVWGELRRLADLLRPDHLAEMLWGWITGVIPHELRTFFEWVWHWLKEGAEFVYALITGDWPEPMHHSTGRELVDEMHADRKSWADDLRNEHGKH